MQLNKCMSTNINKHLDFCAPNSKSSSIIKQLNLSKPNCPLIFSDLSLSCHKNSIPSDEPEFTEHCANNVPQIFAIIDDFENEPVLNINENLSPSDIYDFRNIIIENYLNPSEVEVKPYDYEMNIHLTTDAPFYCAPRRLSYYDKAETKKIIDELLEEGIIQPSNSPYASAIVLVKKKNGKTRMCIDYRSLNKVTVRDNYPLPLIEDCIEYLDGKKYFSVLDLKSGFHHVKVAAESMKYTSFVTPNGQYEYRRMPFGLKNAPAVFQRFVNHNFKDLLDKGLIVIYMDDLLLATKDLIEHKLMLSKILQIMSRRGLSLNMEKCQFVRTEIEYLGYAVSSKGIRPSDHHIAAIKKYPLPTNAKEVQSCLGLFSYFRRFVPSFSRVAKPLQNLLWKDAAFNFDKNCYEAFYQLKQNLISSPVLAIYNPRRETELHTDASSMGFGAALLQKQKDGKFHPIAYYSKTASAAESKYHSFELETLAILYALQRFRVYLEGIEFTVVTDCNSLAMTLEKKQMNQRIARWALEFERFTFTTKHRPGLSMGHVDALSRCHPMNETELLNDPPDCTAAAPHIFNNSELQRIESEDTMTYSDENTEEHRHLDSDTAATVDYDDVNFQLQVTQNRDPIIVQIRSRLENEDMTEYLLEDGLLYRRGKDDLKLFYVPSEMENNIIRLIHEKIGHQSVDKCCTKIRMNYWFPKMKSKVLTFINNCLKCIMYAASVRPSERSLFSIPKKPIPFDTLHLDHFGPLPSLISKRKHVLVVIDAFTKYVKLYSTNSTSTREVTAALEKYFMYYIRPRRIITDRGTCFTSSEFDGFLSERNISHIKVATASPQANGQVERVNRVMKSMLGKLSEPLNHADWSKRLLQVEAAINNSIHSVTKQTPSKLLFGVEQRGEFIDELTEYLDADKNTENHRNLGQIRAESLKLIERSQNYSSERAIELNRPAKQYNIGDFVVIRNVDTVIGTNKKLIPKYRGPYMVHKILGHDRYVIRDVENCQLTQLPYDGVVEANKIRRWLLPCDIKDSNCDTDECDTNVDVDASSDSEEDFLGFRPEDLDRGRSNVSLAEL